MSYVAAPIWVLGDVKAKFYVRPTRNFLRTHLQEPDFFWFTSDAFLKRHVLSFWDSYVKFLQGDLRAKVVPERTTYRIIWGVPQRVPSSVSASRLRSGSSSWEKNLRNLEELEDRKKGTLSNQPWLTRVTPTALLGSWVLHDSRSKVWSPSGLTLRSKTKWQGSNEEPGAKDFVARKVCTIKLNEVQRTYSNTIKCKERLRRHPDAVVRQATINLYSRVWKFIGDYFPKLYCVDLVEAYVTWVSVSSRILCEKKRYDSRSPNGRSHGEGRKPGVFMNPRVIPTSGLDGEKEWNLVQKRLYVGTLL